MSDMTQCDTALALDTHRILARLTMAASHLEHLGHLEHLDNL